MNVIPPHVVTIPLANGRVKTFRGFYSGQTVVGPDGRRTKPGTKTGPYYAKQAMKMTRKATTAPIPVFDPNPPQTIITRRAAPGFQTAAPAFQRPPTVGRPAARGGRGGRGGPRAARQAPPPQQRRQPPQPRPVQQPARQPPTPDQRHPVGLEAEQWMHDEVDFRNLLNMDNY